jgi:hypothetical protein
MKNLTVVIAVGIRAVATPSFADVCSGVSGNIVANCGFEGGVYTSTNGAYSNTSTPNSWTANLGYDEQIGYNQVQGSLVNSGSNAVKIGNTDNEPEPTLSQVLTDVAGATYSGTVYVNYGGAGDSDSGAFFDLSVDGTNLVALNDSATGGGGQPFVAYTFSFVGTGSDTLTFGGNTNPSEWFVDDISVVESQGPPPTTTPEPASMLLLLTAGGPLCWMKRRFMRG